MPQSVPKKGLQAIILCGPGVSFTTFASNPDDFPKAMMPIGNRPMVWYPINLCHRMGIDDITLIAPRSSEHSINHGLETNAHLVKLEETPRLLCPKGLEQTTGTAAIFRLPEVRALINGDFIVLPCDLVCEVDGRALLNTWMVQQPWPASNPENEVEALGEDYRGGLTMYYDTKSGNSVKGEETDFLITTPLGKKTSYPKESLLSSTSKLVYSMPKDTLNDTTEDNQGALPIRHAMVTKHPRLRVLMQHRDAHFYIFPAWVVDMINSNPHMESLAEDVIGWWAKAEWQKGLGEKLGLRNIFKGASVSQSEAVKDKIVKADRDAEVRDGAAQTPRIGVADEGWGLDKITKATSKLQVSNGSLAVPPIVAYVHPSNEKAPLIQRVDTAPLLLSMSLKLAKLGSVEEVGQTAASPFAHQNKVASPKRIPVKCSISRSDCLIGHNVSVEEKVNIKESVIGPSCRIHEGAKLIKCVVMDGVTIGKYCRLTNCIIGRKAEIGERSILTDCEVQDGHKVDPNTEEKGEKIMSSEGLEVQAEQELLDEDEDEEEVTENRVFD